LKLKNKILDFFEAKDVFDHDLDVDEYIRQALEKYQRLTMTLKQILKKQKECETKEGTQL
jgi:hypothetical protein